MEDDGGVDVKVVRLLQRKEESNMDSYGYQVPMNKRRRVKKEERAFIWQSTEGKCYICSVHLPYHSSWHVEHVVAFSVDQEANDVLGNMLPACANCNLRKNDQLLENIVRTNTFPTNVLTAAASLEHLKQSARNVLERVLKIKHDRIQSIHDGFDPAKFAEKILRCIEMTTVGAIEDIDKFMADVAPNCPQLAKDSVSITKTKLGTGGFGDVFAGIYIQRTVDGKTTLRKVAVKIVKMGPSTLREINVLDRLGGHANIVAYYGWWQDRPEYIAVVIERCTCSLMDMLIAGRPVIAEANPFKVVHDVATALAFMHQFSCMHRDVKPANILIVVRRGMWISADTKLCDFGTAKPIIMSMQKINTPNPADRDTDDYACPLSFDGIVGPFTDIHSLGQVMLDFCATDNMYLRSAVRHDWELLAKEMKAEAPDDRPTLVQVQERVKKLCESVSTPELPLAKWILKLRSASSKTKTDTKTEAETAAETAAETEAKTEAKTEAETEVETEAKTEVETEAENGPVDAMKQLHLREDNTVNFDDLASCMIVNDGDENTTEDTAEQEDKKVFLSKSAKHCANPGGKSKLKYHCIRTCYNTEKVEVDEIEARAFQHTKCCRCYNLMNQEEQHEDETD